MTPMKPPRWGVYRYRRVLAIFSIVALLLAALITTSRDDHGDTIAALPGATAQPSVPGGGGSGSGGNGGAPPFPMQPPAMPDAPAPFNGGSYPAPYQGNGININNPAEQPAQVPQQQPNSQQTNPQQLQPANGQQPPDYDAPLQTAQPQPNHQAPQSITQQTPQVQPTQQQEQPQQEQPQQQDQNQQQQQRNPCDQQQGAPASSPGSSSQSPIPPKRPLTDEEQAAYDYFRGDKPKVKLPSGSTKKSLDQRFKDNQGLPESQRDPKLEYNQDPFNTGTPTTGKHSPDHLVPIRRVAQMPRFAKLDRDVQQAIFDAETNMIPVTLQENISRKERTYAEYEARGDGTKLDPAYRARRIQQENDTYRELQRMIDEAYQKKFPGEQIDPGTATSGASTAAGAGAGSSAASPGCSPNGSPPPPPAQASEEPAQQPTAQTPLDVDNTNPPSEVSPESPAEELPHKLFPELPTTKSAPEVPARTTQPEVSPPNTQPQVPNPQVPQRQQPDIGNPHPPTVAPAPTAAPTAPPSVLNTPPPTIGNQPPPRIGTPRLPEPRVPPGAEPPLPRVPAAPPGLPEPVGPATVAGTAEVEAAESGVVERVLGAIGSRLPTLLLVLAEEN